MTFWVKLKKEPAQVEISDTVGLGPDVTFYMQLSGLV